MSVLVPSDRLEKDPKRAVAYGERVPPEKMPTHGSVSSDPAAPTSLVLTGEVDHAVISASSESIALAMLAGAITHIDASAVTFIDSAGIGLIAQLITTTTDAEPLTIAVGDSPIPELMKIIGLDGAYTPC